MFTLTHIRFQAKQRVEKMADLRTGKVQPTAALTRLVHNLSPFAAAAPGSPSSRLLTRPPPARPRCSELKMLQAQWNEKAYEGCLAQSKKQGRRGERARSRLQDMEAKRERMQELQKELGLEIGHSGHRSQSDLDGPPLL